MKQIFLSMINVILFVALLGCGGAEKNEGVEEASKVDIDTRNESKDQKSIADDESQNKKENKLNNEGLIESIGVFELYQDDFTGAHIRLHGSKQQELGRFFVSEELAIQLKHYKFGEPVKVLYTKSTKPVKVHGSMIKFDFVLHSIERYSGARSTSKVALKEGKTTTEQSKRSKHTSESEYIFGRGFIFDEPLTPHGTGSTSSYSIRSVEEKDGITYVIYTWGDQYYVSIAQGEKWSVKHKLLDVKIKEVSGNMIYAEKDNQHQFYTMDPTGHLIPLQGKVDFKSIRVNPVQTDKGKMLAFMDRSWGTHFVYDPKEGIKEVKINFPNQTKNSILPLGSKVLSINFKNKTYLALVPHPMDNRKAKLLIERHSLETGELIPTENNPFIGTSDFQIFTTSESDYYIVRKEGEEFFYSKYDEQLQEVMSEKSIPPYRPNGFYTSTKYQDVLTMDGEAFYVWSSSVTNDPRHAQVILDKRDVE